MKKIYISILTLTISFSVIAQVTSHERIDNFTFLNESSLFTKIQSPSINTSALAATIIWEEDFGDGFPQGWSTYSNNTVSGNATCPWAWTLDGTWGYWNTNNATSASNALISTTASNGFLISDTDSANHFNYGQPSGTTYEYIESSFTTSAIDLTQYPAVSLTFEQLFRYNNLGNTSFTPPTVYVSSDSINWTPFLANGGLGNNTQSSNPENKIINITAIAAGQPTVYLKFSWVSRCYYWMIDDIRIIETPANIIEIEDVVVGGYWIDFANYSGGLVNSIIGLDYSITPISQLANHPYVIEGVLRNRGFADQTSMLKYEVSGAVSYSGSSALTPILAYSATNTVDSVIVGTPPLSPSIGVYDIAIWGESDSAGIITTLSDTVYKGIEISDYIYGKDLGSSNPGSYSLGGPNDQNHIITRYEMYANEELYSLRVYITARSAVGALVKAIIYEVDTTTTSNNAFLIESDNYILTAQDTGRWIDIPFTNPISLFDGYAYEVGLVGFQSAQDSSFVGVSGGSMYNGEHRSFDEYGLSTQSAGTPTWYYITSTPMVRLNFDPASVVVTPAGLEDLKSNISIYPNPSNGIFVIALDAAVQYDLNVYNVLGQTIYTTSTNAINTIIDLSNFDKGIYTIELEAEGTIYIEKIIVD